MGNVLTVDLHRDHRVSSIENLKQMPYIDSHHQKKKRSIIFNTSTWKRLVESTRKKGSKGSKINPSNTYADANAIHNGHLHARHGSGLPAGQDSLKKSQSLYVINTKTPNGLSSDVMKPVLQQPRTVNTKRNDATMRDINSQFKTFSVQQARLAPTNNTAKSESQDLRNKSSIVISDNNKRPPVQNNGGRANLQADSRTKPSGAPPRKVVIQASTSELLLCLGKFICRRCRRIELEPSDIVTWLRGVDRTLLMQGWQDITFIMPSSVVFVYMLCREMIPENVSTVFEVQCIVLTCLYMSYSYMGNEISYPLRPFLIEPERYAFWSRCCRIMDKLSGKMLRINNDAQYFTTVFRDLKGYSTSSGPAPPYSCQTTTVRSTNPPSITVGGR